LRKTFENGTWGGEIRSRFEPQPGDIMAVEHWCSSGFANTDLDLHLKTHGIQELIVIGLRANTCVEATVGFAAELGYEACVGDGGQSDGLGASANAEEGSLPSYSSKAISSSAWTHLKLRPM